MKNTRLIFGTSAIITAMQLFSVGCLTLTRSKDIDVPIDSVPQGANVFQDGELKGTTPLTLRVSRRRDTNVTVRKDGFKPISFPLRTTAAGVDTKRDAFLMTLDICLLGFLVDMASDSIWGVVPSSVNLVLLPASDGNIKSQNQFPPADAAMVEPASSPLSATAFASESGTKEGAGSLGKLDYMHRKGFLSDEEYEQLKNNRVKE